MDAAARRPAKNQKLLPGWTPQTPSQTPSQVGKKETWEGGGRRSGHDASATRAARDNLHGDPPLPRAPLSHAS